MTLKYDQFLDAKLHSSKNHGFEPLESHASMYDFQRHLTEWAIRKGRSAIFADCGLGKTLMQLVWAENVVIETNKPVLILTPLAVSQQTQREAEKFGIQCSRSIDGSVNRIEVIVSNYEKLHMFDRNKFGGVVCDESSILKNFDGKYKAAITEFMRLHKYRLLCTATAAPNDYIELGTSSEALGEMGYMDMLGMFFKNDQNSLHRTRGGRHDIWQGGKWRFKPHAEKRFWQWLCSWARACRKPSDLGFDDGDFILPPLTTNQHVIEASRPMDGFLFTTPARGLAEQRQEKKHTLTERCEAMAELMSDADCSVIWTHLNAESDRLTQMIKDSCQVAGKHSDEYKEEMFLAFETGQLKTLITKPKIGAFGLNWQHCNRVGFFSTHSYEQFYQAVRRCWRFGQQNAVTVDVVSTAGESEIVSNLQRKSDAAEKMFDSIVEEMNNELSLDRTVNFSQKAKLPSWV